MLVADLALEPAWPWSLPNFGLPALLVVALLLAALTVWTYVGVKSATGRRVAAVLILRLLALLVAFSMMMRPSFAITQLEGVEMTKLLVVLDASESMNVVEAEGTPSRWDQVTKLWESRKVQRRLEQLKFEQKIEVVRYLAAKDLGPDEPKARADGKHTEIGAWLHQLRQKHGHEKSLRGVLLVSDGADNGTQFAAADEAARWRGIAPIHAFGVGDPSNPKFRQDIALTSITVVPELITVKSKMTVKAVAQSPGYEKTKVEVGIWIENVDTKGESQRIAAIKEFEIKQEKNQAIEAVCEAPEEPGEYRVTLKIEPPADMVNQKAKEISTYVQVVKQKINVLWVDRLRVYEPIHAIRFALAPEKQFAVHYITVPTKEKDPRKAYQFDKRNYDVIIIGDISSQQFSMGDSKFVDTIVKMVEKKTGLLMLGGTETFAKGAWQEYPALMDLLPVKFDAKAEFNAGDVRAEPAPGAIGFSFIKLDPDVEKNNKLWKVEFEPLEGIVPLRLVAGSTELLREAGKDGKLVLAATKKGEGGHVAVFAGDSTSRAWRGSETAVAGYKQFWKKLVFWLAQQEDRSNQLVVHLDRRRINANAAEILGFNFRLRGKDGVDIANVNFKAHVLGPDQKKYPVSALPRGPFQQQGTFQGAKDPGEHRLVVEATGVDVKPAEARFLVAFDDLEMLRPLADHESLRKIAANAEGRFQVLDEAVLLAYLDELKGQVERESRHKTTHWPDWQRLPSSDRPGDQLAGLWNSFALVSFFLFTALLGGEWLLRRLWGLV